MLGKYKKEIIGGGVFLILLLLIPLASTSGWGDEDADAKTMLGQMVMVGFRGTGQDGSSPDLEALLRDVQNGLVGGVVLFEPDFLTGTVRNIKSLAQVRELTGLLQQHSAIPLLVAVDQEGGAVRRFRPEHGFPATPSAKAMGEGDSDETRRKASELGARLAEAGINLDFAPVLDVDINSASPAIGARGRSFSADPETVARHAKAFAAGLWAHGVLYCYKHFPGHGSAGSDSHAGFTDISRTWSERELLPYGELLEPGMPGMVMLGHVTLDRHDPEHPASLSKSIAGGLLREQLKWDGVVITDDMQMGAIADRYGESEAFAMAVNAGVDIILVGGNLAPEPGLGGKIHATLSRLLAEKKISPERVAESYRRIMKLKKRLADGPEKG